MPASADRKVAPLLLAAAILVVAVNAWFAYQSVERLLYSENWVQHTWQVIYQVERITGSVRDAESGSRGFAITGNEASLDYYQQALEDLPGELNRFQALTADNASQQHRLEEMRELIRTRLETLATNIQLHRNHDTEAIAAAVVAGKGRVEMHRLIAVADSMEEEERRLLLIRTADTRATRSRALFSVALASGLDFLLIILMFRYFARERGLRVATEDANLKLATASAEIAAQAEQVRQLNVTLEERVSQRTAELATTNRELEAFSYSVSHDLRAPLRTIDGFSLALEEDYADAVDAVGRDYILRVRTGVQRMGALIDALLQLSRITRAEITRSDVDISAVAKAIATELHDGGGEGALVDFRVEPGMRASADPKLLRVALDNLMGNAVKFSAKVAHPTVDVGWDAAQSAWFVRDNGAGFDMYYADKLFNAFNRLHGDKDFKGSGIGLATVARVIRRHHGRIWANSVVNDGATFWFTLG